MGVIDWFATLSTACPGNGEGPSEIIHHPRKGDRGHLITLLVDTSGSTLKGKGLSMAKGAIKGITASAYRARHRIALVRFGGSGAELITPPGKASKQTGRLLDQLTGGGGTPLAEGLAIADQLLLQEQRKRPMEYQTLIILTDGRVSNLPEPMVSEAQKIIIDMELAPVRLERSRGIAEILKAGYIHVEVLPVV